MEMKSSTIMFLNYSMRPILPVNVNAAFVLRFVSKYLSSDYFSDKWMTIVCGTVNLLLIKEIKGLTDSDEVSA